MIIPRRWRDVQAGTRVKDPAGQIFHVLSRFGPMVILAATPSGQRVTITIDPDAFVPTLFEPQDIVLTNLRTAFPDIEYLKG